MQLAHGIYIITGIMASGKTTVSQQLSERFERSAHVHGDFFRTMVISGRAEMTPDPVPEALEQLRLRYRLAAQTAEAYFAAGFTTVVQDNYLGEEVQGFLEHFTAQPVFFITLCPAPQVVAQREAARNKTGYVDWDVEGLHTLLMQENPRIGLWLDTSDMSVEDTVDAILQRAEKEARIR